MKKISNLSHSVIFLYFFALISEKGFLIIQYFNDDFSPWNSLSGGSEKLVRRGKGRQNICEFFAGRKHVVKHQKITANHKELTYQVNNFSAFLCMGKCKNPRSLKCFLIYMYLNGLGAISRAQNVSHVFSILNSVEAQC